MLKNSLTMLFLAAGMLLFTGCFEDIHEGRPDESIEDDEDKDPVVVDEFYFGADLSFVNDILDHGGIYKVDDNQYDPYEIFADKGANLIRLRLWHNPTWTETVYGDDGTQMYSDLNDVAKAIGKAKTNGMKVLLDFHFSDTWADPDSQKVPAAWTEITELSVLSDSVYNYVYNTLSYLNDQDLMPELVQIGNETNCGMLLSGANDDFPYLNVCDTGWADYGTIVNRAITAVRTVSADTKVLLHVADPKNVNWWFTALTATGGVTDFDMIGISYYPLWHTTVSPSGLEDQITSFLDTFGKEVIILETAYPWTTSSDDTYSNQMGGETAITGYPYTNDGQRQILIDMTQSLKNAGASGIIYWEPAWITSQMKDLWGTGSSWENNAFFDFDGNANSGFDFMTYEYTDNE